MTNNTLADTIMTLPSDTDIVFSRTFAAPRDRVWAAWTQCEHLKHWWGPAGWDLPVCEMDLRPEGSWKYTMRGEMEGETMESHTMAVYTEVVAPEKLVYKDYFADASFQVMPGMPVATITVNFEAADGGTTVTTLTRYASKDDRDSIIDMGVEAGFRQTLERLVAHLKTMG
jgi:uncharacterized protein YndB with AHSA1/START domain